MKFFLISFFLILAFKCFSQTQSELNYEAKANFVKVNANLKKVYQEVLSTYVNDKKFIKNLKSSQRLWVKFRDAELAMRYPNYSKETYVSVQSMCEYNFLTTHSEARIAVLQQWLDGIEEGDVCIGSIKFKED